MSGLSGEAVIHLMVTEVLQTYEVEPERAELIANRFIPFILLCSGLSLKERDAVRDMFKRMMDTLSTCDPAEMSKQGKAMLDELNKHIKVN